MDGNCGERNEGKGKGQEERLDIEETGNRRKEEGGWRLEGEETEKGRRKEGGRKL